MGEQLTQEERADNYTVGYSSKEHSDYSRSGMLLYLMSRV